MNPAKAIELSEIYARKPLNNMTPDEKAAHQLGIEALKLIREGRGKPGGMFFHDLPGETPETAPTRSLHHIKAVLESPLGREPRQ